MRVHLLNPGEVERLLEGREPSCENHSHLSLRAALTAERREELTFVQGIKYATRQRTGEIVVKTERNQFGEKTGLVRTQRQ